MKVTKGMIKKLIFEGNHTFEEYMGTLLIFNNILSEKLTGNIVLSSIGHSIKKNGKSNENNLYIYEDGNKTSEEFEDINATDITTRKEVYTSIDYLAREADKNKIKRAFDKKFPKKTYKNIVPVGDALIFIYSKYLSKNNTLQDYQNITK